MALTREQSVQVQAAMDTLRSMGCAVCIFMPEDVESAAEANGDEMSGAAAADWLVANRKWIEDGMAISGNQYISDNMPATAS